MSCVQEDLGRVTGYIRADPGTAGGCIRVDLGVQVLAASLVLLLATCCLECATKRAVPCKIEVYRTGRT